MSTKTNLLARRRLEVVLHMPSCRYSECISWGAVRTGQVRLHLIQSLFSSTGYVSVVNTGYYVTYAYIEKNPTEVKLTVAVFESDTDDMFSG